MEFDATQVSEATIEAVVIRADGTIEDLGVISSYTRPAPSRWRALLRRIASWRP